MPTRRHGEGFEEAQHGLRERQRRETEDRQRRHRGETKETKEGRGETEDRQWEAAQSARKDHVGTWLGPVRSYGDKPLESTVVYGAFVEREVDLLPLPLSDAVEVPRIILELDELVHPVSTGQSCTQHTIKHRLI